MREMEVAQLGETVRWLPDRNRYVLIRRYDLDDQDTVTFAQLSGELCVSG